MSLSAAPSATAPPPTGNGLLVLNGEHNTGKTTLATKLQNYVTTMRIEGAYTHGYKQVVYVHAADCLLADYNKFRAMFGLHPIEWKDKSIKEQLRPSLRQFSDFVEHMTGQKNYYYMFAMQRRSTYPTRNTLFIIDDLFKHESSKPFWAHFFHCDHIMPLVNFIPKHLTYTSKLLKEDHPSFHQFLTRNREASQYISSDPIADAIEGH